MICEGVTGYLVDPDDVDVLGEPITLLLTEDILRDAMGVAEHCEAKKTLLSI